jgi:hypothetical protein
MTTEYTDKRWVVSYIKPIRYSERREFRFNNLDNAIIKAKLHSTYVWDNVEKVAIW